MLHSKVINNSISIRIKIETLSKGTYHYCNNKHVLITSTSMETFQFLFDENYQLILLFHQCNKSILIVKTKLTMN